jgi:hypothetical protein
MNEADARRYAHRMFSGILEQVLNGKPMPAEPLVYDCFFEDDAKGRRMSKADEDRVYDKLIDMQSYHSVRGKEKEGPIVRGARQQKCPKVDGKPRAKWKGYKDQRKRQGYTNP